MDIADYGPYDSGARSEIDQLRKEMENVLRDIRKRFEALEARVSALECPRPSNRTTTRSI